MKPSLQERASLAFLVQELTAPAMQLLRCAEGLKTHLPNSNSGHVRKTVPRVLDRAEYLARTVQRLASAELKPKTDDERKELRHDLRGAAGYIVSACEDLGEEAAAGAFANSLAAVGDQARKLLTLIGSLFQKPSAEGDTALSMPILDTLAALPASMARAAERADRTAPGRVLLIDDNEFNRDLVGKMLTDLGHEVELVNGGQEAMDRLRQTDRPLPDLLLCDVLMPGITGIDLLKWLKADPALWSLPVLMVSALGDDEGVFACIAAGAEDYLTRPVKGELLRARIAGCLEMKRLRDREKANQGRIDRLVRALFPGPLVEEWRQNETIRPKRHEKIGVLFTDIAGFTAWCETQREKPEAVVASLQDLIRRFEATSKKHGVQKIKTIGDAFMAVAGLDAPESHPAEKLLHCAFDLLRDAHDHPLGWKLRIGIHVGPVVSGILGETQFTFDVWGQTVNVAARMESNGVPGYVTVSSEARAELTHPELGIPREAVVKGIGRVTVWDFKPGV